MFSLNIGMFEAYSAISEYDTVDKSISDHARLIMNATPNQIRMEISRYALYDDHTK